MNGSALVGLLALGFVTLAADPSSAVDTFRPEVIRQPPVISPYIEPGIVPGTVATSVHGVIRLRPKGQDMSWCSSLKVTARVQSITWAASCTPGGIACTLRELVV